MNAWMVKDWGRMTRVEIKGEPRPGMVRLRVKYAGVGRTDVTAVRGGYLLAPRRPFSPGYEVVGTDPDGQRVAALLPRMGGYREFVDLPARWVVPLPPELDDRRAACLPLNGLTALALLEKTTDLAPGARVLVHGAGGGVGRLLVELALQRGLKVWAVASAAHADLLGARGAVWVDRKGDWEAQARSGVPSGFDAVFDAQGVPSFRKSWKLLAPRGVLAAYGFAEDLDGGLGHYLRGAVYLAAQTLVGQGRRAAICSLPALAAREPEWYRRAMTTLFNAVISGSLAPVLQEIFPWDRAPEAHDVIAQGRVRGKLLLDFQP